MNRGLSRAGVALCALWAALLGVSAPAAETGAAPENPVWPPSLNSLREPVEQSVTRGVAWLTAAQLPDGSLPERWGNNTGILGLCGQALLAAGITPDHPVHGSNVVKLAENILATQRADGMYWREGSDTIKDSGFMYAHPMAVGFIAECSGMVSEGLQARIDATLPKALALILKAQEGGGSWRYYPGHPRKADLSTSSWNLLALRIARKNGAPVPKEAIERGVRFVYSCMNEGRASFSYFPGWGETPQMTGCGLLCLMLTGHHDDPRNRIFADNLLNLSQADGWVKWADFWDMPGRNEYLLYHATLSLHQFGGERWEQYAQRIFPGILARQDKDGSWNGNIGRPYSTAMHVLCLTAPYEQSPMHQR